MTVVRLLVYSVLLVYFINSLLISSNIKKIGGEGGHRVPEPLRKFAQFRFHFFTIWNFGLQIVFLLLAVTDEASKFTNISVIQRSVRKARQYLFSTLVFPSSLLVMTIFWSIWHIDRELIFPKVIDEFYPNWLNHTLHTSILIPLVAEVFFQSGNYIGISRIPAILVLTIYGTLYQTLYFSVYFQHGVWLYAIYKVLNWTQRVAFVIFQLVLLVIYQQVGISILTRGKLKQTKHKVT